MPQQDAHKRPQSGRQVDKSVALKFSLIPSPNSGNSVQYATAADIWLLLTSRLNYIGGEGWVKSSTYS